MKHALLAACIFFAGVGLGVAIAPEAFGPWIDRAEQAFGPRPPHFALLMGILGGSIVGKWVAAAWLATLRERWAWWALLTGLVVWFAVDSLTSLAWGAGFNVWMINLFPLAAVGLALALHPRGAEGSPPRWNLLAWVCLVNAVAGLAMATLVNTPLFDLWTRHVDAPREWLGFLFGPIGGTIAAHFAMLVPAARRGRVDLVVSSVLAWFLVDSARSAMEGAWFNLWIVNVPCLVLVLGAALWIRRQPPGAADQSS